MLDFGKYSTGTWIECVLSLLDSDILYLYWIVAALWNNDMCCTLLTMAVGMSTYTFVFVSFWLVHFETMLLGAHKDYYIYPAVWSLIILKS